MNRSRLLIASLLLVVSTSLSLAHEIKVLASRQMGVEPGGKVTVYLSWGHRVPVDELVDAAPIERYDLVGPNGASVALKKDGTTLQANSVELPDIGTYTAVAVRKPSVYTYVLSPEGERQLKRGPKTEHAGATIVSASRYQQCAKALLVVGTPSETAIKPLGLPVEIVPLDGPVKWVVNSDVRFQILMNGKPVPTASVEARDVGFKPDEAWCYATESNRKGEFTVRPSRAGTWIVKVSVKNLTQGAVREQYDFDSQIATLTLEVRP